MICTTLFRDFRKNYGELVPCQRLPQTACRASQEHAFSLALTQCPSAHRLALTTTRPSSPLWKERKRTKKESKKNGKRTQLRHVIGIGRSRRESFSRIRELENFLLRAMENVDICIELVRIREFDSSGGRKLSSSFVLKFVKYSFGQSCASKDIRLH